MAESNLTHQDRSERKRMGRLVAIRNAVDEEIAAVAGRPAEKGHLGEWIASRIFGVDLIRALPREEWTASSRSDRWPGRRWM